MNDNKKNLLALIEGLTSGRLMEVFDRYYHNDVVMSENGEDDPKRHGKAANRAYEQFFAENAKWFGARVGPVLGDGEHTAYEMWMDLEFMGNRMQRTQFAVQTWKDGQIIQETFYYKA
jgi:hypothetical protein